MDPASCHDDAFGDHNEVRNNNKTSSSHSSLNHTAYVDANDEVHQERMQTTSKEENGTARDTNIGEGTAKESDGMGQTAALFVWMYLLLISILLVGAVILMCFVVSQYGLVVLVAIITAAGALAVVAATLMSVITGDAKLTKARSTVNTWHAVVKDTILEEIDNLREDIVAFSSGTLLLTYDVAGENLNSHGDGTQFDASDIDSHQYTNSATTVHHKPKSLLFKYVVTPFRKLGKKKETKKSENSRSLFKKKKRKENELPLSSRYVPPVV